MVVRVPEEHSLRRRTLLLFETTPFLLPSPLNQRLRFMDDDLRHLGTEASAVASIPWQAHLDGRRVLL